MPLEPAELETASSLKTHSCSPHLQRGHLCRSGKHAPSIERNLQSHGPLFITEDLSPPWLMLLAVIVQTAGQAVWQALAFCASPSLTLHLGATTHKLPVCAYKASARY